MSDKIVLDEKESLLIY